MRHHIFYHMDADGHASAGVVQEFLERTQGKDVDIRFQPINYGMKPRLNEIQNDDYVYMLDFCLQPAREMHDFVYYCGRHRCRLTWIDHHATTFETLNEYPELKQVPGVRTHEKKAGCEVTWEFYNAGRPTPKLITLISDWDTFRRHDLEEWDKFVVPLQAYLRYLRSDPKHNRDLWVKLLRGNQETFLKEVED